MNQSSDTTEVPLTTLDNPFPSGLQQPLGSSLGLLTGIGSNITFIDQDRSWSKVHQYSVDVQREMGGNVAVTVGYTGATGRDLGYGGSNNTTVNINQIDPGRGARGVPGAQRHLGRGGAAPVDPEPVLRRRRRRRVRHARDDPARPAPAPLPAVRRCVRVGDDRRRKAAVPCGDDQAGQADGQQLVGRPLQLHLEQHEGQPVRRDQLLQQESQPAAEQLRSGCRVRAEQLRLAAPDHPARRSFGFPAPAAGWRGRCSATGWLRPSSSS